ncbi:hypothetical protein [Immundisolibacter cernigliae]|uniref:hypothetical protein n=1 Tax=Immundisolibacter cernigliae TaxID=1810504 RepID=UPI0011AB4E3F|nr:hypothetical protein [Immundisolibacter cernigliae]
MKITYLKRDDQWGEDVNFYEELPKNKIHYVSVAMPGLTMASSFIDDAGFTTEERCALMNTVNQAKETGTLYPKANITLLPSPIAKDRMGFNLDVFNDGDYSKKEIISHMEDAFKANKEYIKSKTMYFDFRNLCVSEELYLEYLQSTIEQCSKSDLPETIITWNIKT